MAINRVKTDELDQWHEYDVYTPGRIIALMDEINEESAKKFIKNIRLLDFVSDKDIVVLLATEGGDESWGLQIFDAIKECHSKVIVHSVGPCWSMGGIILQAADVRKISASATVMLHMGSRSYPDDHPLNLDKWIEENARIDEQIEDILLKRMRQKHPKLTRKQLRNMTIFDKIYTAEQAVEAGLVDKIEEHKSF